MLPRRSDSVARGFLLGGLLLVAGVQAAGGTVAGGPFVHDEPDETDGNVTVLRGHGELFGAIDDSDDLQSARADGRLRPAGHLVPGDLLVLQFRSERLDQAVAGRTGPNATARFFRTLNETGAEVTIEERDHTKERDPADVRLNRSNVVVVRDSANATFGLLVDTGNASIVRRESRGPFRRGLASVAFQSVVRVPTATGDRRILTGSSEFQPTEVTASSPDAGVGLRNTPATILPNATRDLTVNGTVTALPGTNLTVEAVAADGTVLAERRIRTLNPGTSHEPFGHSVYRTTLDLGQLGPDDEFDLVVSDGDPIHQRRVVVGEPPRIRNATARLVSVDGRDAQIAVSADLRLPDGGFFRVFTRDESDSWAGIQVPGGVRVRPTLYVDRTSVSPDEREVHLTVVWDADDDGDVGGDDERDHNYDRTFRARTDGGDTSATGDFSLWVSVRGWPDDPSPLSTEPSDHVATLTPNHTVTPRPTPPRTATPGSSLPTGLGVGALVVLLIASAIVASVARE